MKEYVEKDTEKVKRKQMVSKETKHSCCTESGEASVRDCNVPLLFEGSLLRAHF